MNITTISCWSCGARWQLPQHGTWRFVISYHAPNGPCTGHRFEYVE